VPPAPAHGRDERLLKPEGPQACRSAGSATRGRCWLHRGSASPQPSPAGSRVEVGAEANLTGPSSDSSPACAWTRPRRCTARVTTRRTAHELPGQGLAPLRGRTDTDVTPPVRLKPVWWLTGSPHCCVHNSAWGLLRAVEQPLTPAAAGFRIDPQPRIVAAKAPDASCTRTAWGPSPCAPQGGPRP
jgi:hypothetical protein